MFMKMEACMSSIVHFVDGQERQQEVIKRVHIAEAEEI
jgi:hypothetical protein